MRRARPEDREEDAGIRGYQKGSVQHLAGCGSGAPPGARHAVAAPSHLAAARRAGWCSLCLLLVAVSTGCAGHSDRTLAARSALDAGQPKAALAAYDAELKVDQRAALPDNTGGDRTLFLLDRAVVLHSLASQQDDEPRARADFGLAARDLQIADKQVEMLDFSRGAVDEIGRYLFSDDTGPYKAPPYEKLMINTLGMLGYLARGELAKARVEARRLSVMQDYLGNRGVVDSQALALGSYLAGFVFEKSGKPDAALRYYDAALRSGLLASLREPVRRLSARSSYSSPRLRALLGADARSSAPRGVDSREVSEARAPLSPPAALPGSEPAEVLVVLAYGRVPAKIAKRVPIGLALTYASGALSPYNRQRANYLAAKGLVTWVNYPALGRPRGTWAQPGFALNGAWRHLDGIAALDREAVRAWDQAKGTVIAAAITRMLTRAVVGEVVRASADRNILVALLGLLTTGVMTAADTPDTRSWSTLPARVAVGRIAVQPGTHWVDLEVSGVRKRQRVRLAPGGWAVLVLTELR